MFSYQRNKSRGARGVEIYNTISGLFIIQIQYSLTGHSANIRLLLNDVQCVCFRH